MRAGRERGAGGEWEARFTAGLFYSDCAGMASGAAQKKDPPGTTERYYEMDIPAHGPPPTTSRPPACLPGSDNTGQVPVQMERSPSWDRDWDIFHVAGQDTCGGWRLTYLWRRGGGGGGGVHPLWEILFNVPHYPLPSTPTLPLVFLNAQMFLCLCDICTSTQWICFSREPPGVCCWMLFDISCRHCWGAMPYHDEEYPGQPLWQSVLLFCCKGVIEGVVVILFLWLLVQVLFTKQLEGKVSPCKYQLIITYSSVMWRETMYALKVLCKYSSRALLAALKLNRESLSEGVKKRW